MGFESDTANRTLGLRSLGAAVVICTLMVSGAGPAVAEGYTSDSNSELIEFAYESELSPAQDPVTPEPDEEVIQTFSITYSTTGSTSGAAPAREDFQTRPGGDSVTAWVQSRAVLLLKTGFVFRGWTTETDGGGEFYLPGDSVRLTSNLVLYPAFGGTITFLANGGTGSASSPTIQYTLGSSIFLPQPGTLSRSSFKFLGWRETLLGRTFILPGRSYGVSNVPTGNFSLYATWGRSVSFNSNGATIGSAPLTLEWVEGGSSLTLLNTSQAGLKKRGFDHIGWSTSINGAPISNSFNPTGADQTLYASWLSQPEDQTFRFNFLANRRSLTPASSTLLTRMLTTLDPDAVFPKQEIVVFLQSRRFVTQSSALGKARIKVVRKALRDAGISAKIVWSNETRSSGSPRLGKNNRVTAVVKWAN